MEAREEGGKMNIDYMQIKGFCNLSPGACRCFKEIYHDHQESVEDKKNWIAVAVKEKGEYIKVWFENGRKLRYFSDGTWY